MYVNENKNVSERTNLKTDENGGRQSFPQNHKPSSLCTLMKEILGIKNIY